MTHSKMLKILSSYDDCALFEIRDASKYDFETDEYTCPVRDVVLLSDIIKEFEAKSGEFYETYKFTATFRDFCKLIESGKPGPCRYRQYDDSEQERKEKWSTYHPNETEEQVYRQRDERRRKRARKEWEALANYMHPWHDYEQNVYMFNYRNGWR